MGEGLGNDTAPGWECGSVEQLVEPTQEVNEDIRLEYW